MPALLSRPYGANLLTRGNRKVAFVGDSITAQGFGGTLATGYTFASVGYATWAAFLSRRRIELTPQANFGISGDDTADILLRMPDVLRYGPGACVVLCGTNNIAGSATAAIADLEQIYDLLENKNIAIIAVLVTPRGSLTAAQYGVIHRINKFIRDQRLVRDNFYVVDAGIAYGDNATGIPKTTMSTDGLHPLVYGAYAIGKEIADVLTLLYPDPHPVFSNVLDVYSASLNPYGNLLAGTVGLMDGTAGSLTNGPTGQLATGLSCNGVNMPAGSTTAFAKVAKADGRVFQQITFGGTYNVASPSSLNVQSASVHASVSAGDTIQAVCEFEADAGIQNLSGAQLLIDIATPSGNPVPIDMVANNTNLLPPVAFSGVMKTPPVTLPATATNIRAILRFAAKGVGVSSPLAGVVRFGSLSIRKV